MSNYLTFSSPSAFTIATSSRIKRWDGTLYYSTDTSTWSEWTGTIAIASSESNGVHYLYIRGIGNSYMNSGSAVNSSWILTGDDIRCIGNIENLLDFETVANGEHPIMADYCYYYLFGNCTSLTAAPELPAITLSEYCYSYMFSGCTSLTEAPELPAITLAHSCYYAMFSGCTSLTEVSVLPATTLSEWCYSNMFAGCTGITTAPVLPSTTLSEYCYASMFSGCTSITEAPELPAITLENNCYYAMFSGCTSLNKAPVLPAINLANSCYYIMFAGCTNLMEAPELPATTLAYNCYAGMFGNCTSLVEAPALPATTLDKACYYAMFTGCSSLTTLPLLPATELKTDCYRDMFKNCTSLTEISELPATYLLEGCYNGMFNGCTSIKLSETKTDEYSLPYTIPSSGSGTNSLTGLTDMFANTGGTFTGTPEINTTYYMLGDEPEEPVISTDYLTFSSPNAFTIATSDNTKRWNGTLYYSTDTSTWSEWNGITTISSAEHESEQRIYMRGSGNSYLNGDTFNMDGWILTGTDIHCNGNIENLLDFETVASGEHPVMGKYCYTYLFSDCIGLSEAPELPATTLSEHCYYGMFNGCTSLTKAPELPATTLALKCYVHMFCECTSLTEAPYLPATILTDSCYWGMFVDCISLTVAPDLPATGLYYECYGYMFSGCTGLTAAPALPATILAKGCYRSMFQECSNLAAAPELPATVLAHSCYNHMFDKCTGLTIAPNLPATTAPMFCYYGMFNDCTSLTKAPELPATTFEQNCYDHMFQNCTSLTELPALPATILAYGCYKDMFKGCTGIKLSETKTDEYSLPYTIPSSGTIESSSSNSLENMFTDTGGTFTGTPTINTTYYLAVPEEPDVPEPKPTVRFDLISWLIGFIIGLVDKPSPISIQAPATYLYNGMELPELPVVEGYPYASISQSDDQVYVLYLTDERLYAKDLESIDTTSVIMVAVEGSVNRCGYRYYGDYPDLGWVETPSLTDVMTPEEGSSLGPIWINYDFSYPDGTLYLAASDPVPVYE